MPTYVNPDKCDGCRALDRPASGIRQAHRGERQEAWAVRRSQVSRRRQAADGREELGEVPMVQPETEVVECDVLIVGGGMAGCGAAYEAAYWAQAKGLRVVMVEKAAVERSGAVAM